MSTELTISNPNISVYRSAFQDTAFSDGAHITINYTAETEALVDAIVATKSSQANIVKGNLVN